MWFNTRVSYGQMQSSKRKVVAAQRLFGLLIIPIRTTKIKYNGVLFFKILANFDTDSMKPIGFQTFCNQKVTKLYNDVVRVACFSSLCIDIERKVMPGRFLCEKASEFAFDDSKLVNHDSSMVY